MANVLKTGSSTSGTLPTDEEEAYDAEKSDTGRSEIVLDLFPAPGSTDASSSGRSSSSGRGFAIFN